MLHNAHCTTVLHQPPQSTTQQCAPSYCSVQPCAVSINPAIHLVPFVVPSASFSTNIYTTRCMVRSLIQPMVWTYFWLCIRPLEYQLSCCSSVLRPPPANSHSHSPKDFITKSPGAMNSDQKDFITKSPGAMNSDQQCTRGAKRPEALRRS